MTTNKKCRLKRQAHKDFRLQSIDANRSYILGFENFFFVLESTTSRKAPKGAYRKMLKRTNALYRKLQHFKQVSSRPFEEFEN